MSKKEEKEIIDNEAQPNIEEEQMELAEQEDEAIAEIDRLHGQIKELEDQYLRTNAEFENIKKRMEREIPGNRLCT